MDGVQTIRCLDVDNSEPHSFTPQTLDEATLSPDTAYFETLALSLPHHVHPRSSHEGIVMGEEAHDTQRDSETITESMDNDVGSDPESTGYEAENESESTESTDDETESVSETVDDVSDLLGGSPSTSAVVPSLAMWWTLVQKTYDNIQDNHENIINLANHIKIDLTTDSVAPINHAYDNFVHLPPEDGLDWSDIIYGYIEEKEGLENKLDQIVHDLKEIMGERGKREHQELMNQDDYDEGRFAIDQLPQLESKFDQMSLALHRLEWGWQYVWGMNHRTSRPGVHRP